MAATLPQARDEILGQFKAAWDLATPPVPPVVYDDSIPTAPGTGNPAPAWARCKLRHFGGGQRAITDKAVKHYERSGVLFIQIFTPSNGGQVLADTLAVIARNAFEGKRTASGVWFPSAIIRDGVTDGSWLRTNVNISFQYDEFKA